MRRGREFYSGSYARVIELHEKGLSAAEIASKLGISYSCVYHWVRGLRTPSSGRISEFEDFLRKNGPMPVLEIKEKFPKHNELFLTASKRGLLIKRCRLDRRFGEYSTWYFLAGQEERARERIKELLDKYKELKEKMTEIIERSL